MSRASVWAREGAANVRHAGVLMASVVGIVASVVAGATWADAHTADQVLTGESVYLAQGGDLLVAYRADGGALDAARCERLTDVVGVRAAGSVSLGLLATGIVGRPEVAQSVVTVTPGVAGLLSGRGLPGTVRPGQGGGLEMGSSAQEHGSAWVPPRIAERWAWAPGASFALTGGTVDDTGLPTGPLRVEGVVDPSVLDEAASTGIVLQRPPVGAAQRCFVRIEPQYRDSLAGALPALLGDGAGKAVQVVDRLPAGAAATAAGTAYDARPTRWVAAAGGAVLGLLWVVVVWTRRGRAALYDTLGVRASEGFLVRWVEGATVLGIGTAWGVAWGVSLTVVATGLPAGVAVDLGLRAGALVTGVLAPVVALVSAWRPRTLAALKDR